VSANLCGAPSPGTPLKVAGVDALAFACSPNRNGASVALVVWLHDGYTFDATYTAAPATFQKYIPTFKAIYESFTFSGACTVANHC
jgi:hypothetical protein